MDKITSGAELMKLQRRFSDAGDAQVNRSLLQWGDNSSENCFIGLEERFEYDVFVLDQNMFVVTTKMILKGKTNINYL